MRNIIESEAEDARLDLQVRIDSLAGDLASGGVSEHHLGARPREAHLPWDLVGVLGPQLQGPGLERVMVSMENLQGNQTLSSGLTPVGEVRLIVDGLEGESVVGDQMLSSPEVLRMETRSAERTKNASGANQPAPNPVVPQPLGESQVQPTPTDEQPP